MHVISDCPAWGWTPGRGACRCAALSGVQVCGTTPGEDHKLLGFSGAVEREGWAWWHVCVCMCASVCVCKQKAHVHVHTKGASGSLELKKEA